MTSTTAASTTTEKQHDDTTATTTTILPNLLGIHALVWVGNWSNEECIRKAISNSKQAGYDIIEIPALEPECINIEYTIRCLKEYNMKATVSLGLAFDCDINNEDPTIVQKGLQRLLDALHIVEQLGTTTSSGVGCNYLGGVLYSALGKYSTATTTKSRHNAITSLKTLAQVAQKHNITIGLEPVNRYESNLINTAQQALDLIDEIDESNVVVHLDIYHMNIEEVDLVSPVIACATANKLGYVHIGASHRGSLLDGGNIDFESFFRALAKVNYRGIITFESFSSAVVDENLTNALAIWRNTWTDNMKLAIDAHDYISNQIQQAHSNNKKKMEQQE